jgi:ABC-type transporter Mla subunit MlaD
MGEAARKNIETMSELLQTAGEAATTQMRAAMDESARSLESASDRLLASAKGIGDLSEGARGTHEAFKSLTGEMESLLELFVEAHGGLQRIVSPMDEMVGRFDTVGASLRDALAGVEQLTEELGQSHQRAKEMATSTSDLATGLTNRFEGLDRALDNSFRAFEGGLRLYHEEVTKFVGSIDESFGKATSILASTVSELESQLEELAEIVDRLKPE